MYSFKKSCEILDNQLVKFSNVGPAAIQLGKGGISKLCKILSNPQQDFASLHIAGTNGKGTVATILYTLALNAGHFAGLFTSPYLLDFRECIRIGDDVIPEEMVCRFVSSYEREISSGQYSRFEVLTAMAFWAFREAGCSLAIVECGLGGKDDSTNILFPELSIVTNIGMDHANILGNSLEDIAIQKAGICKPEIPLLLGSDQKDLLPIFKEIAQKNQSPLFLKNQLVNMQKEEGLHHIEMLARNRKFKEVHIREDNPFFLDNLQTALAAASLLPNYFPCEKKTYSIWYATMQMQLSEAGLNGRWQLISEQPRVIFDGAHNPASWLLCTKALQQLEFQKLILVFAQTDAKDPSSFFKALTRYETTVICTSFTSLRVADPKDLARIASSFGLNVQRIPDPTEAYSQACLAADSQTLVLCTGSLYLIRELLKNI